MAFTFCCTKPHVVSYDLHHTDLLRDDAVECSHLLWHLPEVDSFQASHDTPLSEDIYDDLFVDLIKEKLGLSNDDIKIDDTHPDHTIDDSDAAYFEDKLCLNCSKVIIAKAKGKDKTTSFLSHVRNSIAHGYFNIVDGVFIGFDHPRYGGRKYTGVIKVRFDKLQKLLNTIETIQDTQSLYRYFLSKMGYQICDSANGLDFLIEKDDRRYYLEFKKFAGRYIDKEELVDYIASRRYIDKTDVTFILIVDSTYTNSKINSFLVDHNICILDKKWVKELIQGKDIFEELTELRKQIL